MKKLAALILALMLTVSTAFAAGTGAPVQIDRLTVTLPADYTLTMDNTEGTDTYNFSNGLTDLTVAASNLNDMGLGFMLALLTPEDILVSSARAMVSDTSVIESVDVGDGWACVVMPYTVNGVTISCALMCDGTSVYYVLYLNYLNLNGSVAELKDSIIPKYFTCGAK